MSNHSQHSQRSQRNNNHEFWTRFRHEDDTDETPTARCAFSWHIAAAFGVIGVAVLYTQSENLDDNIADQVAWGRQVPKVLTVSCTALLALFVATPMIYFVVNTTTVVTK